MDLERLTQQSAAQANILAMLKLVALPVQCEVSETKSEVMGVEERVERARVKQAPQVAYANGLIELSLKVANKFPELSIDIGMPTPTTSPLIEVGSKDSGASYFVQAKRNFKPKESDTDSGELEFLDYSLTVSVGIKVNSKDMATHPIGRLKGFVNLGYTLEGEAVYGSTVGEERFGAAAPNIATLAGAEIYEEAVDQNIIEVNETIMLAKKALTDRSNVGLKGPIVKVTEHLKMSSIEQLEELFANTDTEESHKTLTIQELKRAVNLLKLHGEGRSHYSPIVAAEVARAAATSTNPRFEQQELFYIQWKRGAITDRKIFTPAGSGWVVKSPTSGNPGIGRPEVATDGTPGLFLKTDGSMVVYNYGKRNKAVVIKSLDLQCDWSNGVSEALANLVARMK